MISTPDQLAQPGEQTKKRPTRNNHATLAKQLP